MKEGTDKYNNLIGEIIRLKGDIRYIIPDNTYSGKDLPELAEIGTRTDDVTSENIINTNDGDFTTTTHIDIHELSDSDVRQIIKTQKLRPSRAKSIEEFIFILLIYDKFDKLIDSEEFSVNNELSNTIFINDNKLIINPGLHFRRLGYTSGKYHFIYKFYRKIIKKENALIIKQISPSRKEIVCKPKNLENITKLFELVSDNYNGKAGYLKRLTTFVKFNDYTEICILNSSRTNNEYKFKLRDALDSDINIFDEFFVYNKVLNDFSDNIRLHSELELDVMKNLNVLRPPDISSINNSSLNSVFSYESLNDLVSSDYASGSENIVDFYFSSSLIEGIPLNIDYRNFSNFINFSSAKNRLDKFVEKLSLIESYNNSIYDLQQLSGSSYIVTTEIASTISNYSSRKRDIINKLDGYEKYMYFNSGSYETSSLGEFNDCTWPKINTVPAYNLYSVTSSIAKTWYTRMNYSASLYDTTNDNMLLNTIPTQIRTQNENNNYVKLINLVGRSLDSIYVYIRYIDDINNADTSLTFGIPKDLILHSINHFGMDIYSGNNIVNLSDFIIATGSNQTFSVTGSHDRTTQQ